MDYIYIAQKGAQPLNFGAERFFGEDGLKDQDGEIQSWNSDHLGLWHLFRSL